MHGVNTFTVFHVLILLQQKRKKATTFKLMKHTQKHAVTTEDRILIRHYRLDKSIEPENMSPNNTNRLLQHNYRLFHTTGDDKTT